MVSWEEVPFPDQNGVIRSYTVTYRALSSNSSQTKNVTAPASQATLTGLNEYTNYSITVFASTSKGGGNQSTPIVVITDEDSKFVITEFAYIVLVVHCMYVIVEVTLFYLNNNIAEHHLKTNHAIDWDSATCLTYSTNYYQRITLESWLPT